jgi:hypothetical protein
MMRYVVIATARRGAVEPFEPLDFEGQMKAFQGQVSEPGALGNTVVWAKDRDQGSGARGQKKPPMKVPLPCLEHRRRVERMLALAAKTRKIA